MRRFYAVERWPESSSCSQFLQLTRQRSARRGRGSVRFLPTKSWSWQSASESGKQVRRISHSFSKKFSPCSAVVPGNKWPAPAEDCTSLLTLMRPLNCYQGVLDADNVVPKYKEQQSWPAACRSCPRGTLTRWVHLASDWFRTSCAAKAPLEISGIWNIATLS